ncbi:MAG: hypothetical protein OES69_12435 [Myxococcales bacterium]|nr:hypothetical protein [Myxococcales bacterium]MDH3844741.1 hypothetical protein [Myxococcales bacterium]
MKISPRAPVPLEALLAQPRRFVARLVLAELLAKRGAGPLERKALIYGRRPKR